MSWVLVCNSKWVILTIIRPPQGPSMSAIFLATTSCLLLDIRGTNYLSVIMNQRSCASSNFDNIVM